MNKHYVQSLFDEALRTCGVIFEGGKQVYTYKHRITDLKEKDRVVVQTPDKGLQVCNVVRVDDSPDLDPDSSIDYRWIVARVDMAAYDAEVKNDEAVFARVKDLQREHHRKSARAALLGSNPELVALTAPQAASGQMPGWASPPQPGPGGAPTWAADAVDVKSTVAAEPVTEPAKPTIAKPLGWDQMTPLQQAAFTAGSESAPRAPNPYNPTVQPDLYNAYQQGINNRI